ncbi:ribonuclease H-like domain-containing protein [Tanacetum coccineum]
MFPSLSDLLKWDDVLLRDNLFWLFLEERDLLLVLAVSKDHSDKPLLSDLHEPYSKSSLRTVVSTGASLFILKSLTSAGPDDSGPGPSFDVPVSSEYVFSLGRVSLVKDKWLQCFLRRPSQPIPKTLNHQTLPRFNSRTHHSAMTNSNTPPPPPALTLVEKLYAVHNINSLVPEKLDLQESNYSTWSYFFKGHCSNFNVLNHIDGSTSTSDPPTDEWITADSIVKSWIFLTLSPTLRKRMISTNPASAKAAWDTIETIFQENKRTRTVALKGELRVIQMGDDTPDAYFSKIDSIITLLTDLGSTMDDDDIVTYAINGLSEKYGSLAQIIAHKDPFPDLATVRTMVTTEEMRLRSKQPILSTSTTSSSPQVLLATSQPRIQDNRNNRDRDARNENKTEICRNFGRGYCRWGTNCRFIHASPKGTNNPRPNSSQHNTRSMQQGPGHTGLNSASQQHLLSLIQAQQKTYWPSNGLSISHGQQPVQHNNTNVCLRPKAPPPPPSRIQQTQTLHPRSGSWPPAAPLSQLYKTNLPHQDPANSNWNMDTGASSHLNSLVNNLSTIFNSRIYPSVLVGDGKSIPVTNTGHSTLPTPYRTLHLNNDFWTSSKFSRCDRTGDPLSSYVSVVPTRLFWLTANRGNQRLGHPGSEGYIVFRDCIHAPSSLVSGIRASNHVCLLHDLFNGLKQPLGPGFQRLRLMLLGLGFIIVVVDSSLIHLTDGVRRCLLAFLYVDDIVLTASSSDLLQQIITSLHAEFSMTDLGSLNYFLGISVTRNASGMFLSQQKYATKVLDVPVCLIVNVSLAGALQYLTFTRPDISYAVQQVCLFMHDPREPHLSALKRILRYVRGTLSYGLQLYSSMTSSLVAYSDADWAGCPTTRRSTSGYCVFLGNNLLSWSSKRQFTLSRSSAEAEYRGVANAVAETCWLRNLLRELHTPLATATLVYCDNVSAIYLSSNPVQHQRTKHIEIDIHFVRDQVLLRHSVDGNEEGTGVLHVLTHCKETCCCPRFRNRLHLRLPASVDLCRYVGCRAANANDDSSGDLDVITGDVTLNLRHIASLPNLMWEQDEEEEDEKSGTIFFLPTHKLYLRPICKFNPGNALGSNQKESSSYEYQQSLMPKGITPIAVRTSRESQTWVRNLRYNHVPTDSVTARIKITQMRCTQHTPTPVSMTPPSVQHQLTDHQKTKGHTQRAQPWRLQRLTFATHSQTTSNGLSFKMAEHVKSTVTRIVFRRIRDHEEHQFTILWSSRHFLRLHLKVKNVESRKEASEIGKFRQMDETVVAVVADMHSEGTTDLIAGGAAIVLCMAIKLETFCCTSDLSFVRVRSDPMDVAFTNAINMWKSQMITTEKNDRWNFRQMRGGGGNRRAHEQFQNGQSVAKAFRLMMGRELEGLSYKELDNLEPELHDGMLAPQLSIQKETTETFLIEPL